LLRRFARNRLLPNIGHSILREKILQPRSIGRPADLKNTGLLLGIIHLQNTRNLAVPIIAHGVTDTIDFLLIFLEKYPEM